MNKQTVIARLLDLSSLLGSMTAYPDRQRYYRFMMKHDPKYDERIKPGYVVLNHFNEEERKIIRELTGADFWHAPHVVDSYHLYSGSNFMNNNWWGYMGKPFPEIAAYMRQLAEWDAKRKQNV
jgi:hypothetical protein